MSLTTLRGHFYMVLRDSFFTKWLIASLLVLLSFISMDVAQAEGVDSLEKGEEGEQVEVLQEQLVTHGYLDKKDATAVFSTETEEAVTSYQEDHALIADGVAGAQTLGALTVLHEGSEGRLVYTLQEQLQKLAYYRGALDGIYGQLTKEAVITFQQSEQIQVDGIAGPETHRYLYDPQVTAVPQSTEKEEKEEVAQTESHDEETAVAASTQTTTESIEMEATAYTAYCNGCSGVTSTGIDLRENPDQKVVAVDPNVIPLGSRVYVEGYGEAIAGDTGGAIKGHKIDLYMQTKEEARTFGRRTVNVTVLE